MIGCPHPCWRKRGELREGVLGEAVKHKVKFSYENSFLIVRRYDFTLARARRMEGMRCFSAGMEQGGHDTGAEFFELIEGEAGLSFVTLAE